MADVYAGQTMLSSHITSLMRRINALEAASSTSAEAFDRKWGGSGTSDGLFDVPSDITQYGGEIYVVDNRNDRIQVFNTAGTFQRKWGSTGAGDGSFNGPIGVFVSGAEVYVTDSSNRRVQVFDTAGAFQRKWGSAGSGDGEFALFIRNICVYNNEVYVVDPGNTRVQVFNTSGVYQRKWGASGTGDGQFTTPWGIAEYGGEIYVSDTTNDNVQVFSTAGVFQRQFGSATLNSPQGLFGVSGEIYVADRVNDRICIFDTAGNFRRSFGTNGSGDGEFLDPFSVVAYNNEIYTTDNGTDRVQVFTPATPFSQTTFYGYDNLGAGTSLGTPDGGVSIPALNGLKPAPDGVDADISRLHIIDMRTAIQTLAPYFTNAATGNPFNWTASSADNLYFVANGDRTEYGATGGARYDWTRTSAQMLNDFCYSIDIGECLNCITTLEAS